MTAWIQIGDVLVQPWALGLVYSQSEATKLNLADAREAVKAALTNYGHYQWVPTQISGDAYIVVGQEKPKKRVFETS
jgi:predicted RNA-binding protein with PIN domain